MNSEKRSHTEIGGIHVRIGFVGIDRFQFGAYRYGMWPNDAEIPKLPPAQPHWHFAANGMVFSTIGALRCLVQAISVSIAVQFLGPFSEPYQTSLAIVGSCRLKQHSSCSSWWLGHGLLTPSMLLQASWIDRNKNPHFQLSKCSCTMRNKLSYAFLCNLSFKQGWNIIGHWCNKW